MKKITMPWTIGLLILGFTTCASAEMFTFSGTLADSSKVTGTFDIDPIGGTIISVDLLVADDPSNTYNQVGFQSNGATFYTTFISTEASPTQIPLLSLGW
jgi:hypothetical protein